MLIQQNKKSTEWQSKYAKILGRIVCKSQVG